MPVIRGLQAPFATAFNRTTLELKRAIHCTPYFDFQPFNRTTLELKPNAFHYASLPPFTFNRTTLELKPTLNDVLRGSPTF